MVLNIAKFLKCWWPTVIVMAVVCYAIFFPDPVGDSMDISIPHLDKLIHAIMMGGIVAAVAFDLQRADMSRNCLTFRTMAIITLSVMAFGVLSEILQSAMGLGRTGDIFDIAADWGGALIAAFTAPPAIHAVLEKSRRKNM